MPPLSDWHIERTAIRNWNVVRCIVRRVNDGLRFIVRQDAVEIEGDAKLQVIPVVLVSRRSRTASLGDSSAARGLRLMSQTNPAVAPS